MECVYRQCFTRNDNGYYDLLIIDHKNERYCLTKIAIMPAGRLVDRDEFNHILGKYNNTIQDWLSLIEPRTYTEVDYLEPVTKLQEYVLWEAVKTRRISAEIIMEKFDGNPENANRLMAWMESMGFISPEINGVHRVLMTQDDYGFNFMT